MDLSNFNTQVIRLKNVYGDKFFSEERTRLLWNEVCSFDSKWFQTIVDEAISTLAMAPMVKFFSERAAEERGRLYKIKKSNEEKSTKEFMTQFSGEDLKMICETIKHRIHGRLPDEHFKSFQLLMNPPSHTLCQLCENSGVMFQDNTAYKCRCHYGRNNPRNYPMAHGGLLQNEYF